MQEMDVLEPPVGLVSRAISIVWIALGVLAAAFSLYGLIVPPFTDVELRDNFVDTWEAHVLGGTLVLAIYCVGLLIAGIGVWLGKGSRAIFTWSCGAFVLACLLEIISLELLTERTENLVGHELQWLI
jgi:hypothetical protein